MIDADSVLPMDEPPEDDWHREAPIPLTAKMPVPVPGGRFARTYRWDGQGHSGSDTDGSGNAGGICAVRTVSLHGRARRDRDT